jgi:hypothetical protein
MTYLGVHRMRGSGPPVWYAHWAVEGGFCPDGSAAREEAQPFYCDGIRNEKGGFGIGPNKEKSSGSTKTRATASSRPTMGARTSLYTTPP